MKTEPPKNLFVRMAQTAASVGWCYDFSQFVAGAPLVHRRLRELFVHCAPESRVLDVGGGTGAVAKLIPRDCHYICLDIEMPKLQRCLQNVPRARVLLADATHAPIREASIDIVTCMFVVHHLTDEQVGQLLAECRRVLKPSGHLIVVEPVWNERRLAGRFLWSMDRGSFPRTPTKLRAYCDGVFRLIQWKTFAVFHEYAVAVCQKS